MSINKTERIAIGALIVILITNPASGQIVLDGLEIGFTYIFRYGSIINFIASLALAVYVIGRIFSGQKLNTVPKTKKPKVQYLET